MPTDDAALTLTDADKAMLSEHAEDVTTEAKRSFSLRDRLQGMKRAESKIVLFTDPDAARDYAEQAFAQDQLGALLQAAKPEDDGYDEAQADFDEGQRLLEQKRAKMLESALAVHMRAVPQVVIEAAQRSARKAYALKDGTIPDEVRERFVQHQNHEILGSVVTRVVDAEGNDYTFDPSEIGDLLLETLPVPQYQRLIQAFNLLVFNDALAQQATDDPGF